MSEISEGEIKQMLDKLADLNSAIDLMNLQKKELIDSVLTPEIKTKLAEIDAEFEPMKEAMTDQIADLENKVRMAASYYGKTVKGQYLTAVWSKGRTSWDDKKLEGLMILLPQLSECRKIGSPSISIRKV